MDLNSDGDDPAQGIEAVRAAALDSVRAHLEAFPESLAREDLWENHPLLIEREALEAEQIAEYVAAQFVETLKETAVYMFTKKLDGPPDVRPAR